MKSYEVFNVYKVNSLKSITRYTISKKDGEYSIKMKMKESFIDSSDCVKRILELEDSGYSPINMLLATLNIGDINSLFNKNINISNNRKIFNLTLNKKFNI